MLKFENLLFLFRSTIFSALIIGISSVAVFANTKFPDCSNGNISLTSRGEFLKTVRIAPVNGSHEVESKHIVGVIQCLSEKDLKIGILEVSNLEIYSDIELSNLAVPFAISFLNVDLKGGVKLDGVIAAKHILFRGSAIHGDLNASSTKILGNFEIHGSDVLGRLIMDDVVVGGDTFLSSGRVPPNRDGSKGFLICAPVGSEDIGPTTYRKDIYIINSEFQKGFCMMKAQGEKSNISNVYIGLSRAKKDLSILESSIDNINLYFSKIDRRLNLGRSKIERVLLTEVGVSENVLLLGLDNVREVNMEGAHVKGDIVLSDPLMRSICWQDGGSISFRNTEVSGIVYSRNVAPSPWPSEVDISGFKFAKLVEIDNSSQFESDLYHRNVREGSLSCRLSNGVQKSSEEFYLDMLGRVSPLGIEQINKLSAYEQNLGNVELSEQIRYFGSKIRTERDCNSSYFGKHCLTRKIEEIFIGYGIGSRIFRIIIPILLFWIIGTFVAFRCYFPNSILIGKKEIPGQVPIRLRIVESSIFSIDRLTPFIDFNSKDVADRSLPPRIYFVVHTILGWFFAGFFLAGITGLTSH